jgi:hypothetical protein
VGPPARRQTYPNRGFAEPRNHSAEADGTHGCAPLAQEQVAAWLLLALKATQGAEFGPRQRVDRGYPALEPRNVQPAMDDVDLLPTEGAQLGRSQPVPEGQQDHGRIAMSVRVPACRLHQPLDLSLGQVLAGPCCHSSRSE